VRPIGHSSNKNNRRLSPTLLNRLNRGMVAYFEAKTKPNFITSRGINIVNLWRI